VGVDPAVSGTAGGDETGIVVAGRAGDQYFVLADTSGRMTPNEWASRVVSAYYAHQADEVVAEANQGGEMVRLTIHSVDDTVPVRLVHATRGKRTRAEPVHALYEQGKVKHVGVFAELEDQLCLAGTQKVITRDGAVESDRLVDKTVEVIDGGGQWRTATCHHYGRGALYAITVSRYGARRIISATAAHRWVCDKSSRKAASNSASHRWVRTRELLVGDRLVGRVRRSVLSHARPDPVGMMAGFVFGDGWTLTRGPASGIACFEKDEEVKRIFEGTGYRFTEKRMPSGGNVPRACAYGLPAFMNQPPNPRESATYLYGWLAGYFAADGHASRDQCSLTSTARWRIETAQHVCAELGIVTGPIQDSKAHQIQSPDGRIYPSVVVHQLSMSPGSLSEDFFLLSRHRDAWAGRTRRKPLVRWVVESVEEAFVDDVFCMNVPGDERFVLADTSILSGNCSWVPGDSSPDRLDALVWAISSLREKGDWGTPMMVAKVISTELEQAKDDGHGDDDDDEDDRWRDPEHIHTVVVPI
jgi:hypothetical protein